MKKRLYNCLKENEFNLDIKNDKFLNITYEIYHTFYEQTGHTNYTTGIVLRHYIKGDLIHLRNYRGHINSSEKIQFELEKYKKWFEKYKEKL